MKTKKNIPVSWAFYLLPSSLLCDGDSGDVVAGWLASSSIIVMFRQEADVASVVAVMSYRVIVINKPSYI
jgi:hypothetical protein